MAAQHGGAARRLAPLLLAGLAGAAAAHETWLAPVSANADADATEPGAHAGAAAPRVRLALGTGEQFPVQQSSPGRLPPPLAACRLADGQVRPMTVARDTAAALLLDAPVAGARQCWASLPEHQVTLRPAQAAAYLDDIRAPEPVRRAWAARVTQQGAAQAVWRERFVKSARIVLSAGPAESAGSAEPARVAGAPAATASPMPLDIVPEALPAAPGGWLRVQVLRDGLPLPGLNLQVASARAGLGLWLRSDAQGRAALRLPLAGAWLVRATELRAEGDSYASRWATLTLEVAAR